MAYSEIHHKDWATEPGEPATVRTAYDKKKS